MRQRKSEVAIVGGGIIGLTTAFRLAGEGCKVTLFDDAPGHGASHAAAGMLAPGAETTPEHSAFTALSLRARAQWPELAASISTASDRCIQIRTAGSLFVGWNDSDVREQARYLQTAISQAISVRTVTRDGCRELFEGVTPRLTFGTLVESDAYVDCDEVIKGLLSAIERLGVELIRERAVHCGGSGSGVVVDTASASFEARCGILANGYDSSPLDLQASFRHKLRPIRGVTIRLQGPPIEQLPMIRAVVKGRVVYVIRRPDGSVIIGASSDESAERVVESGTVRRLLEDASLLVPGLNEIEFVEARVGLRPVSSEQIPFFEELESQSWAWSGGHFRHGYLLAPVAADDALDFVRRSTQ